MLSYTLLKLFRLLIPALVLAGLAPVIHTQLVQFPYYLQQLLQYLPAGLGLLCLILCITFNQGRLLLGSINILGLYLIVQTQLQTSLNIPANFVSFSLLTLLFPTLQLFISFLPERGLSMGWLWSRIPIVIAPYFLIWTLGLGQGLTGLFPLMPMGLLELAYDPYLISQWGALAFTLTLLLGTLILWFRASAADATLLMTTISSFTMLALFSVPMISTLLLSLSLLLILFTVLYNSYSMAFIDELTGLPGRRALENTMNSAGRRYTLGMVDVDHFKKFNDTYGHDVGDQVLKMVASQMKRAAKGVAVYRYGGEEFTLVFRGMDETEALPIADRIRDHIANYPMKIRDKDRPENEKQGRQQRRRASTENDTVQVCVSIGLCEKTADIKDSQAVIKKADEALYLAKQQGRNRCIATHIAQPRKKRTPVSA